MPAQERGESEIFALSYGGYTHFFADPGARKLWAEEMIALGARTEGFEFWDA